MMRTDRGSVHVAARRSGRTIVLGLAALAMAGCKNMLDVDNPNNVTPGALEEPTAASAIVNGAINIAANALSSLFNAYNIISDETFQTGSRDDYRLLDTGGIEINTNEYLQASYLVAMRGRWMAEQAIAQVGKFDADGRLADRQLLAKAYLMGAVSYDGLANIFDDVAISDRTTAGKNLGEANMVQLYDSALKWLDAGAAVMVRYKVLAETGFFDPAYFLYFEEVDLMRQAARRGWQTWHVADADGIHMEGAATGVKSGEPARKRPPA